MRRLDSQNLKTALLRVKKVRYPDLPKEEFLLTLAHDMLLFLLLLVALLLQVGSDIFIDYFWPAIVSFVLTALYIYIYDSIERKYFGFSVLRYINRNNPRYGAILTHRFIFFCFFVFFQAVFLAQWGLYNHIDAQYVDSLGKFIVWQTFYIAAIMGLISSIGKLHVASIKQAIFYYPLFFFLIIILSVFGRIFALNEFLQQLSTTIVIAILLSAGTKVYLKIVGYANK